MAKNTVVQNDAEKVRKAASHVIYEWDQLHECDTLYEDYYKKNKLYNKFPGMSYHSGFLKEIANNGNQDINPDEYGKELLIPMYNLVITSFAVHARNLLNFFHTTRDEKNSNSKFKDDVIAADFVLEPNNWIPVIVEGKDASWISAQKNKVNKLASHLTYTRVQWDNSEMRSWDIHDMYDYLLIQWDEFHRQASPDLFQHVWNSS